MCATLLAGCSAETTLNDAHDDSASSSVDEASATGAFRLLISDRPVAIDDFDELNVSLDRARIFPEGADEAEADSDGDETESETTDDDRGDDKNDERGDEDGEEAGEREDEKADAEADGLDEEETGDGGRDDSDQRGFQVIDLDGATVDLTRVVGNRAIGVFEGELEEGRYTKIELYAADVEGIVEGDPVDVTIPSGKLQIVKPFEIVPEETLSFVFDINVVRRGRGQEYNLLPVISESGVAGQDVEVEEIGDATPGSEGGGASRSGAGDTEETDTGEPEADRGSGGEENGEGGGPPDDIGEDA